MTDRYLSAILEEAEQISTHHEQAAHLTENAAHEYLRYAALKLLEEGPLDPDSTLPRIDDVTVGYGQDTAVFESWHIDVVDKSCTCPDWQQRSPAGGCKHLRRVDHEIKHDRVPRPDGRLPADATDPD
jgi:hypothetical protein